MQHRANFQDCLENEEEKMSVQKHLLPSICDGYWVSLQMETAGDTAALGEVRDAAGSQAMPAVAPRNQKSRKAPERHPQ